MHYYEKGGQRGFRRYRKWLGGLFVFLGIGFVLYFFFPVISYQIFLAEAFSNAHIEVPIPKYLVKSNNSNIGGLISQGISSFTTDFTDARNWYPQLNTHGYEAPKVDSYSISIPKLKIENAIVSTRDYDLEEHLVQYFGTAIPGDNGTAVVFGHSTLPSWFDPKNYKTIFATLHTIKTGDEIFVTVNGATYKYKIFSILVTDPEDTNILSQSYDNSYLTIVTCTPPGTIWKRLIVRAALESTLN